MARRADGRASRVDQAAATSFVKPGELPYRSICRADEQVHAMRYHWPPQRAIGWQRRDHWYVSLVEEGTGVLYLHGDELQRNTGHHCPPGCLRIVPAETTHRIDSLEADGVVEVYFVFTAELVRGVRDLLGNAAPASFPWQPGHAPWIGDLSAEAIATVRDLLGELIMQRPQRHDAVAALCRILQLQAPVDRSPYTDLPSWLRTALIRMRSPNTLQEGPQALARLCGRSLDHVNRVCRKSRGVTATQLVNELRIELACSRLRLADDPIAEIAALVGLPDVSHFYRVFKKLRTLTPRAYRLQHRA